MYCKNCGKQIGIGDLCKDCESILGTTVESNEENFDVVKEVNNNQNYNTQNNYSNVNNYQNPYAQGNISSKSKIAAGLFGIFLGSLGIHNFYLGYTGKAIAQLLITVLSCGILGFASALWGLIEGILILAGDMRDANGNILRD